MKNSTYHTNHTSTKSIGGINSESSQRLKDISRRTSVSATKVQDVKKHSFLRKSSSSSTRALNLSTKKTRGAELNNSRFTDTMTKCSTKFENESLMQNMNEKYKNQKIISKSSLPNQIHNNDNLNQNHAQPANQA